MTLFSDRETGQRKWINTSKKRVREIYYNNFLSREHGILEYLKNLKLTMLIFVFSRDIFNHL
jgi:hypothetical protein